MVGGAGPPGGVWACSVRDEDFIAVRVGLHKRSAGEAADFRLRRRLNRLRAGGEIQLSETLGARCGGTGLRARSDNDTLRAGGDASGAGIGIARDASDSDGQAGPAVCIEQVDILRAEIGGDELRVVRSERQAAESRGRRRAARRCEPGSPKGDLSKIEDVYVIDVAETKPLAALIVEDEFVEGRHGTEILVLQILKGFCCSRGAPSGSADDLASVRGSGGRLQSNSFELERIAIGDTKNRADAGDVFHVLDGSRTAVNGYAELRGVGAEPVAADLNGVTARLIAGIGKNLKDLRAVAEGMRGEREPTT